MPDDVVLPFPDVIQPVKHIRSTLLLGSLTGLRDAELYDPYVKVVATSVRAEIESAVAGMWIPVQTAIAHYQACDRLGLTSESAARLGRATFSHTKGLLLGTAIGLARGVGVTPWVFAPHLHRFWTRGCDGGAVQAAQLGPKEMRIDIVACPPMKSRYFRAALRGLTAALVELVSQKAYVHEVARADVETAIAMRVQWV